MTRLWKNGGMTLLAFGLLAGCARHVPVKPPVYQPRVTEVSPEGTWQTTTRKGTTMQMVLKKEGGVEFKNGLGFYNPGHWDFDPMRNILTLTLPYASDERLQIFKLYVGDGVKAFDRERKQVHYDFTAQTDTLNVGGWLFTRAEHGTVDIPAEPTLK
jgi:hypothetical protein